jgi:DNA modification methylase
VSIPFNVPGWAIGDSLALARQLPDESIDCIVTSPPYWGLRSYLADDDPSKALEMGAEPTLAEYVERLVVLFRELRRALKDGGTCWLNLGDSYSAGGAGMRTSHPQQSRNGQGVCGPRDLHPSASRANSAGFKDYGDLKPKDLCLVPYRVALALQADGWWLRDNIVWHKPNPMPASVTDRCTSAHEAVFLLTKSARYFYDADAVKEAATTDDRPRSAWSERRQTEPMRRGDPGQSGHTTTTATLASGDGRNKRNVWTIATKPYSGSHYAVMPPALVEPCIQAGCPSKVCADCGAPWERVKGRRCEREGCDALIPTQAKSCQECGHVRDWKVGREIHEHYGETDFSTPGRGTPRLPGGFSNSQETQGWQPTCSCDAATRPGIVLDPFGGSGTVGQVAESLGRKWLLFDLDARNEALMAQRTAQRSLLGMIR